MPIDLLTGESGGLPVSSDQVQSGAFEGLDWFGTTNMLLRANAQVANEFGPLDENGRPLGPPLPKMTAEEANEKYGQKSQTGIVPDLSFDKPITEPDAAAANADWHDRVGRADAAARAPGGFFNGAARFATNSAAFMLDPLNAAASVIPIVDEAAIGGALARAGIDAGANVFARTATRMATGFVSGAVNQTPLVALRGGLSWMEHGDYTSAQAMSDLVMGGLFGGGIHTIIGGAGDIFGRGFLASPAAREIGENPVARDAAMRTATAQIMDGRPVEINGIVNIAAAERAETELAAWAKQHQLLDAETDKALADSLAINAPPDRRAAIEAADSRVTDLQAQLAQHEAEIAGVRVRAGEGIVDPATADRIAAIHTELGGTISGARRADLQSELTMLTEGRDQAADALEFGRAQAQTRGLQASRDRVQAALAQAQEQLAGLQKQATTEAQQAAQARLAGDRLLQIRETALASRRAVLAALQARTLRRFAGAVGSDLEPGEAESLVGSINAGSSTTQDALRSISGKRGGIVRLLGDDGKVQDALAQGMKAIRAQRDGAVAELAGSDAAARAQGAAGPEEIALREIGAQALKEAEALKTERPELPPEIEEAAEIERQWKDMQEGPKPQPSQAPVSETLQKPEREPDFKGGNADVWRDGNTVIRYHREASFTPRYASGRILQPSEIADGGRLERLPFVDEAKPLSAFSKSEVRGLMEDLRRDGLAVSDIKNPNFGKVDGELKVIDPGAALPIRENASDGLVGRNQFAAAKEFGVDLKAADPTKMLTAAERAEMRQMDEEFAQAKKDGDVWQAAAQCLAGE